MRLLIVVLFAQVGCGSAGSSATVGSPDTQQTHRPETPRRCHEAIYVDGEDTTEETHQWVFDDRSRLIRRTTTTQGQPAEHMLRVFDEAFDARGWFTERRRTDGSRRPQRTQQRETVQDGDAQVIWTYDQIGTRDRRRLSATARHAYHYGLGGRITKVERRRSWAVTCAYDPAGRLIRAETTWQTPTGANPGASIDYSYDSAGRLSAIDEHAAWRMVDLERVVRVGVTHRWHRSEVHLRVRHTDDGMEMTTTGTEQRRTISAGCETIVARTCSPLLAPPPPRGERYRLSM